MRPPNNGSALAFFQNVSGSTSVYLPVSESVNGVFFNGGFSYYNLFGNVNETGPNTYVSTALTLGSGGLSYFPSSGSTNSQLSLPVVVGIDQTWTVGNGTLQLQGSYNGGNSLPGTGGLRGSGNVTLAGMNGGRLEIDTASPGYSGNFTVMAGATLRLGDSGALGSGTLILGTPAPGLASGYPVLDANPQNGNNDLSLSNAVVVNGYLGTNQDSSELTLAGPVTLAATSTFSSAGSPLWITGSVGESGGSHQLVSDGFNALVLAGANSYTGGTLAHRGAIIFGQSSSIPFTPSVNALQADATGYIGIAFNPGTNLQAVFLSLFNPSATTGIIGFDSPTDTSGNYFTKNNFTGNISLAGFNPAVRIGTATQATLSGTITPQGTTYQFGGGGGFLTVGSTLTDQNVNTPRSLSVQSPAFFASTFSTSAAFFANSTIVSAPLSLLLTGANTYTGPTSVTNSSLVFAPGALPAGTVLNAGTTGYIGSMDAGYSGAGMTAAAFLARFNPAMQGGTIGFDSPTPPSTVTISDNIDLSPFTSKGDPALYLGSITNTVLTGTITLPAASTAYRFAAYQGGQLNVASALTGNYGVVVGDPNNVTTQGSFGQGGNYFSNASTVILSGANTYAGGTTLYIGSLLAGGSSNSTTGVFGSGSLTVQPNVLSPFAQDIRASLGTAASNVTIPNNVVLNATLQVGGSNNFALSGVISGPDQFYKSDANTVLLSGNNTLTGGIYINQGTLVIAGNYSAGPGPFVLADYTNSNNNNGQPTTGGNAYFSASNPVVYNLSSDSSNSGGGGNNGSLASIELATNAKLTVNQSADGTYSGSFIGDGNNTVIKTGSGRLYLDGYDAGYQGGFNVKGGVLVAQYDQALGTGNISVNGGKLAVANGVTVSNSLSLNSGSLGGFGTFSPSNPIVIGSGFTLAPGGGFQNYLPASASQTGALSIGNNGLSFGAGGIYRWQLSSTNSGSGADYINVLGSLNITASSNSPFTIKLVSLAADGTNGLVTDFNPSSSYSWAILGANNGINGFSSSAIVLNTASFSNPLNGGIFSLSLNNNFLDLNFTPSGAPVSVMWRNPFGGNWNSVQNWQGGIAPAADGSADVYFTSGSALYVSAFSNLNLHSLNLSGGFSTFNLFQNNGASLILQSGGLTYSPTASVSSQLFIPVNLVADQTWNITNGSLQVSDGFTGDGVTPQGNLTKTGAGLLDLPTNSSSYTGNITLLQGGINLGNDQALGNGTLTIGPANTNSALSPYLTANGNNGGGNINLGNPVILNGLLSTPQDSSQLNLKGPVTLAADTVVSAGGSSVFIDGNVGESGGSRMLTVNGFNAVVLTGANTYTGGTTVTRGLLVFGQAGSLPSTPAANALSSTADGYIGLAFVPASVQSGFLNLFNKAATFGTIGFDSDPSLGVTTTINDTLDLTGFGSSARLGSATTAQINGTIIPQGANYQFGGGGGTLTIASALTGTYGVQAFTPSFPNPSTYRTSAAFFTAASTNSAPPVIILTSGSNSYTGPTSANNAALVFGPGALPAGTTLNAGLGGYIGTADPALYQNTDKPLTIAIASAVPAGSSGGNPNGSGQNHSAGTSFPVITGTSNINQFVSQFDPAMQNGVIGFDTFSAYADVGTSNDILGLTHFVSASDPGIYLGSSTNIGFWPAITLPANSTTYRFAGYQGGQIDVHSALTGATSVVVGDPYNIATIGRFSSLNNQGGLFNSPSVVVLSGANSYAGGTSLYAGELIADGPANQTTAVLGSGALTVQPNVISSLDSHPDAGLGTVSNNVTVPNSIVLNAGLQLMGDTGHDYTLTGVVSGSGELLKAGNNTVTLATPNTFAGGLVVAGGTVVLADNYAAGPGPLSFDSSNGNGNNLSPTAVFTTASPVIGGFSDANGNDNNARVVLADGSTLTIDQATDADYRGTISGPANGLIASLPTTAALLKTGSGNLSLDSANSYSGGTTILQGALIAGNSNALGTGTVTLSGGKLATDYNVTLTNSLALISGKIGGFGTYNPPGGATIAGGVILSPGGGFQNGIVLSQPGTVAFGGSLTLAGGGAFHVQLVSVSGGNGSGWDYTNVLGALSITANPANPFTIKLVSLGSDGSKGMVSDFNPYGTYSWQIIGAVGGINGFSPSDFTLDLSSFQNATNGSFSVTQNNNFVDLNFTPVPEPATWALLLTGAGLIGLLARRRR